MTDTSTEGAPQETSSGVEIQADVDGLSIDGTAPSVGDHVDVKVGGTVSKVVNGVATIAAETVNDTPMPAPPAVDTAPDDSAGLGDMAAKADLQTTY